MIALLAAALMTIDEMGKIGLELRCETRTPAIYILLPPNMARNGDQFGIDISPKEADASPMSFGSIVNHDELRLGFDKDPNAFIRALRWAYFDRRGINIRIFTADKILASASFGTQGSFGNQMMTAAKDCLQK